MTLLFSGMDSPEILEFRAGKTVVPQLGMVPSMMEGMIHVWSAPYSDLGPFNSFLSALVSPEEMQRARQFKKQNNARQYILRHGMVRSVLGHYLHKDPKKIRFFREIYGKPYLDLEDTMPDIRFSLSHTDEMICLGITKKSAIGLDLVKTLPGYRFSPIERYLFTRGERRWIAQAVPGLRPLRFFRIWALKEALLKSTGSSARIMQEGNVAGIMTDTYLNGWYPVYIGKRELLFFIHESGCGTGHHRVIAAHR